MQNTSSAQNTPQPTSISTTKESLPTTSTSKKKPWLLIVLVVLLLGATGVFAYKYYEVKQQLGNQQTAILSPQPTSNSPIPTPSTRTENDLSIDQRTSPSTIRDKNEQKLSFKAQIDEALKNNSAIEETNNPNLILPLDIDAGQIKKFFKIDNILLALVLRNSMNIALMLPSDFTPMFAGVLAAEEGDTHWSKLVEIRDAEITDKNNPYYLMADNQKLLLTVVDQNGAGSGEGIMKVFGLTEMGSWKLEQCYYFGENYNDPSADGDYFAFSTKFSKQTKQPLKSCNNVQLIERE